MTAQRKHLHALSPREDEVLRLVAAGLTNQEVGDVLGIGNRTVETHLTHCFDKLGCNKRMLAVVKAGLLTVAQGD